jgi:hypothetical protein
MQRQRCLIWFSKGTCWHYGKMYWRYARVTEGEVGDYCAIAGMSPSRLVLRQLARGQTVL